MCFNSLSVSSSLAYPCWCIYGHREGARRVDCSHSHDDDSVVFSFSLFFRLPPVLHSITHTVCVCKNMPCHHVVPALFQEWEKKTHTNSVHIAYFKMSCNFIIFIHHDPRNWLNCRLLIIFFPPEMTFFRHKVLYSHSDFVIFTDIIICTTLCVFFISVFTSYPRCYCRCVVWCMRPDFSSIEFVFD